MQKIKQYIPEILVFGFIFAIMMIDLNPDYTFVNKAADSVGYIYSAKFLYPSYHTSPPLYLLVSHLFLMIPLGTDAWRMGLISVLSSMGACVFIYLTIRKLLNDSKNAKWYALLGVLIYGTSALVISQSVVVQTYATVCLLATGAYYFFICKKWKLMGLMLGMGLAVHLLMGFVFIIMFMASKEYRKNWKALLITFSFGVFYLYIPLTNREPYMWFPNPQSNLLNSVWFFISDTWSTIVFLLGKLAIWDLPKRILDALGILGVSIGVITIIPIIYYFKKNGIKRNILFWLSAFSIVLFISELDMNTFDYMMVAIPFLSIVACLGLNDLVVKYGLKYRILSLITVLVVIGFGFYNMWYFDIGKNIDKNMSASNLIRVEFNKIPDGAIFMPNLACEWEAIYKYNADNGKHIVPICKDILPSEEYQKQLINDGIKLTPSDNDNMSVASGEIARSIVLLNDNVWTTTVIEPESFGSIVVPANHDVYLIPVLTDEEATQLQENPKILWKPYDPYDIMSTQIAVELWKNQLLSNWNVMFFVEIGVVGLFLNWIMWKFIGKKKAQPIKDKEVIK